MKYTISLPAGLAAAILLACTSPVNAHTWVEELRLIASNGSYVGAPGYIRGFGPRTGDPNVNLNLLPPNGGGNAFLPTDLMCKSNQLKGQQSNGFPALSAAPGDQVALRYLENGHVTKFFNNLGKPAGRGTVFIYGTTQSLDSDTYLGIHRVWNTKGNGGDKRGKLIATRPFDDGRCFQVNDVSAPRQAKFNYPGTGGDLLCQADVQMPSDAGSSGSYTLYWVWEWPTLDANGNTATNESYTSCMDISMTSKPVAPAGGDFVADKLMGTAANSAAIQLQLSTQFLVNPTAAPIVTSDNMPPAGVPAAKPTLAAPAPPPGSSPITTPRPVAPPPQAPKPTSQVAGGMFTVTVSGAKEIVTVTVTKEVPMSTPDASPPTTSNAVSKEVPDSNPKASQTTSTITVNSPPTSTSAGFVSSVATQSFATFSAVPLASAMKSGSASVPIPTPFLPSNSHIVAQQAAAIPNYTAVASASASACSTGTSTRRKRSHRARR